ncbi:CheR family methyltransferase, partial [Selenomonas sp.]
MILKEMTPGKQHRILATDLDIEIIAKAKKGVYTDNELKCVEGPRLSKYFTKGSDGTFAVHEDIKNLIEFKRHNLLKDSFETGFDLILCRNVVIYFTEEAKFELYTNFFRALKPGGILFVGATEAILNFRKIGYTSYQPFFYQRPLT